MQELLRDYTLPRGQDGEVEKNLLEQLTEFPGSYRIYCTIRGPTIERFYVEFKTDNLKAAQCFLESLQL